MSTLYTVPLSSVLLKLTNILIFHQISDLSPGTHTSLEIVSFKLKWRINSLIYVQWGGLCAMGWFKTKKIKHFFAVCETSLVWNFLFELTHFQKKKTGHFSLHFWCSMNLLWGHVRPHAIFGPDRFSLCNVYSIQIDRQTP